MNCNKEVQTLNSYTSEIVLKKKIKFLQQKLRRSQTKINNLEDLIKTLKNNGHIDSEQQNLILNNFNGNLNLKYLFCIFFLQVVFFENVQYVIGSVADLFKNETKNNDKTTGRRYTKEIKQLALTLHFYSPKAYNFCR